MKTFLDDHFLLSNKTAEFLYFNYAQKLPIIDYHNHLPINEIAENKKYENITKIWLNGDHYKWRAMRANGVSEELITGNASDYDKFKAWANTVPFTLRNPLYHWTHLELQRYFGIYDTLNSSTALKIYETSTSQLQHDSFRVQSLLLKMNVQIICTTDDPIDSLQHHQQLLNQNPGFHTFPTFRPDNAMKVEDVEAFNNYLQKLTECTNSSIKNFNDFLDVLEKRHTYFYTNGCCLSDHGLEEIYAEDFTESEIKIIFNKLLSRQLITELEIKKFKSALLIFFAELDFKKGIIQQFHLGALRNNNTRKYQQLGPDTGWDSIGDFKQASAMAKFFNALDKNNRLPKTIIYNLNPADNEVFASMIGNFNDGSIAGKIQWGSSWWFLDQKDGITRQINALSNMGLLSKFIGMLTDSRSFLSFPRHEYFRRILCNLFGKEIENGELPNDLNLIGTMIQDICFNNAKSFFNWPIEKKINYDKKSCYPR